MKRPQEAVLSIDETTLTWLYRLASGGENGHVEFKRKAAYPDKIVREMIAFANTDGGFLMVGVADDGTIPGLKYPDEDAYVIRRALARFCRPRLKFKEEFMPVSSNRFVIVYDIPASRRRPHYLCYSRSRRDSFVRVNDRSIKASREVQEIYRRVASIHGAGFTYGDAERTLLRYLTQHTTITLDRFVEIGGVVRAQASDTLISLVLAKVLRVTPAERGDLYSLAVA